jgi:EAL domain-containing protein (putative c-di-GMP-specific phosphodiesterase class I)
MAEMTGVNAGIASRLARYRIPAGRIEFEIAVSVIIKRGDVACQNRFGWMERGIERAIDDFQAAGGGRFRVWRMMVISAFSD